MQLRGERPRLGRLGHGDMCIAAASMLGCARLGQGALEFSPCVGLEPGVMRGVAEDTGAARPGRWLAVVVTAGAAWRVRPRVSVWGSLMGLAAVQRAAALSVCLGVPVIPTVARTGEGIGALVSCIGRFGHEPWDMSEVRARLLASEAPPSLRGLGPARARWLLPARRSGAGDRTVRAAGGLDSPISRS